MVVGPQKEGSHTVTGGARKRRQETRLWARELHAAWQDGDQGRLRDASESLRACYEAEASSYFVQMGRQVLEQDEQPTRFFFSSIRSHQRGSYMDGLK